MLALPTVNREPSPDGATYGSRWSRAKRETTGSRNAVNFTTAAAVAEGIHAAWYLIRDIWPGSGKLGILYSGGLALRARPPATVRDAYRRRNAGFAANLTRD